ncbi:uncharacterized protein LOC113005278 [Solenopsis invicta]|uniref:uncharacterized protein LOC113005278 n=1 Tax=Solenopsis invicta TaxID=13686 RepID=UPI000E33E0D7|nr:uncharacterized protein LOC113005278 [Solenopsis invicta]
MSELKQLRAKRTNIKGQLTQFINFIRDQGENQRAQLADRIRRAEDLYNSYNETQSKIAEIKIEALMERLPVPTTEEVKTLEADLARKRSSVEDAYFEYIAKARQMLEPERAVNNIIVQTPEQQVNNLNVKLPTLQLPKFSGSYDQWLMFKDTFTSVIDYSVRTHIRALETLRQPVTQWDTLLIYLLSDKLDYNTRKDWELEVAKTDSENMPSLESLLEFLTNRAHTLELIEGTKNKLEITSKKPVKRVNVAAITSKKEKRFKKDSFNCLRKGHYIQACTASTCKLCSKKHNTMLHMDREDHPDNKSTKSQLATSDNRNGARSAKTSESKQAKHNTASSDNKTAVIVTTTRTTELLVFVATAKVYIEDGDGNLQVCRAMLDPGAQTDIITKELAKRLNLRTDKAEVPLSGISQTRTTAKEEVVAKIKSMHNDFVLVLKCLVMPTITERLPQIKVNTTSWNIPKDIKMADPDFNLPGTIELLIGSAKFWKLLGTRQRELEDTLPTLQKTRLGWIVGKRLIDTRKTRNRRVCNIATLNDQLTKFWNIEELPLEKQEQAYSPQEQQAEDFFIQTVKRDSNGRYVVRLPKDDSVKLGELENVAVQRFIYIERKLKQQPQLQEDYHSFIQDYETLGHLSLPHQPVIKTLSLSTKLRVVFDGLAKTSSGMSLNQKLLSGPNLQKDLWQITIRFKEHLFVITADIKMMFRQIWVAEEDRDLQRIIWRHLATQPKAAKREATAKVLLNDFYMDDVLTGTSTLHQAVELRKELSDLLAADLVQDRKEDSLLILNSEKPLKTLGFLWNSTEDTLQYSVTLTENSISTKRSILSQIARIYDPLGLIGPVLINAKMTMQEIWKLSIDWDDPVPKTFRHSWNKYYKSLTTLRVVEINNLVPGIKWYHVLSSQNPADLLSRGTTAEGLIDNELWWHDPPWLPNQEQWPKTHIELPSTVIGMREEVVLTASTLQQDLLQRYSLINKFKKVIAYCLRFKKPPGQRRATPLTIEELDKAEQAICRMVQAESFPHEIRDLQQKKRVHASNQLTALNPFTDESGLIRVGGRLKHAHLPYNQKHQIVSPARHHVTEIILREEHIRLKHCGPQHLLAAIRTRYWPLSGRREARKVVRRCIPCFKYRPNIIELRMADLPESRVTVSRPFAICGTDYAFHHQRE